jgi:hypothetical protein
MIESIEFAIPSYNRPQLLRSSTLKLLVNIFKIPEKQITVFLEDEEQLLQYKLELQDFNDIKFELKKTNGIGELRSYIRKFYPVGTNVVMFDDDTHSVLEMKNEGDNNDKKDNKLTTMNEESFKNWINEAFDKLNLSPGKNFGIVLFDNPYYMTRTVSKNLRYVCGNIVGFIVQENEPEVKIAHGEDFEFSIKLFKRDKELLRYNYITVRTKHYAPGGICDTYGGENQREIKAKENLEYLVNEYKGAFTLYKKKNGKYNLRVNSKYKV